MFGSAVLDVVIGMAFVFLLVSTLCAALREGLESMLKTRAAYLEQGIRLLLHDPKGTELARRLFKHPLIYSLYLGDYQPGSPDRALFARGHHLPSYIPARNFATALLDLAAQGSSDAVSGHLSARTIRANVAAFKAVEVQRVVLRALDVAKDDLDQARAEIEAWFDSAMDRVAGWYKRSTQWIMLSLALGVSIGLNIDAIGIAQALYQDDAVRSVLVQRATSAVEKSAPAQRTAGEVRKELEDLKVPIGWDARGPASVTGHAMRVLGWLATAFAATLGAPFWFDVLNKIMVIRGTVKPHEKSPEEDSEDRQITSMRERVRPPEPLHARAREREPELHDDDEEHDDDGCAVPKSDTPDEHLPAAEGGVH